MKRTLLALALVIATPFAAGSQTIAPTARIQQLAREITFRWAAAHPTVATELGIGGYDGAFDDPSAAADERDAALIRGWMRRLDAIDVRGASLRDRDDVLLLRAKLTGMLRELTVYRRFERDYTYGARAVLDVVYTQFLYAPLAGINGATQTDVARAWDDIAARLTAAPAFIVAAQKEATHPGHLFGVVGGRQLAGASDFLNGALTQAAKAQMAPERFRAFVAGRDRTVATIRATKTYV
ncbi:MAG: DUF885 family protein, partial [Candidatus Eremiobacteraeota bacterium]|nr:DUF885 family protein [Candidatus Eremiobacteraeota bacterium]